MLTANMPINVGNTAFMLICASLVMLMTPGLAFWFCRGKDRRASEIDMRSTAYIARL